MPARCVAAVLVASCVLFPCRARGSGASWPATAASVTILAAAANACVLCEHGLNGNADGQQQHHHRRWQQQQQQRSSDPLTAFAAPHFGEKIVNATLFIAVGTLSNASACAQRCLDAGSACIAFTWHPEHPEAPSTCVGSSWSPRYAIDAAGPSVAHYPRLRRSNTSAVRPAIEYALAVPTAGVEFHSGPLADAFQANVQYLLQMPVDDMLHWFRRRAGESHPPGQNYGWDNSGVDAPEGLRGSVAGAFLMVQKRFFCIAPFRMKSDDLPRRTQSKRREMLRIKAFLQGAGGIVRWQPDAAGGRLKQRMADLVAGIRACADDGYIMAFPRNESNYHENPDYVTAWLTHGLLEAAIAGETDALDLLRGHFDWFNSAENLPLFLPPALPEAAGPFFDGNGNSVRGSAQFDHGHEIYLIYQGMIHNSRLALSAVGQQQGAKEKRVSFAMPFCTKSDRFTKTGSGHT